jgi:hypothetical protein
MYCANFKAKFVLTMIVLNCCFMAQTLPVRADTEKTVTTETTSNVSSAPVESTQTTTTETTANRHESHGIIGGFFHVVGQIIAFPFKVVAKVFETVF